MSTSGAAARDGPCLTTDPGRQEAALGLVRGELERTKVFGHGLVVALDSAEHAGADRMPEVVARQELPQGIHFVQRDLRSVDLGQRHRPVQPHDGRLVVRQQHVVEREHLQPVRGVAVPGVGVAGGDRCVQLPASRPPEHRSPLQHVLRLGDERAIPACAVLIRQQDELAIDRPRTLTRAVEQQQGQQPLRLRLAGKSVRHHPREPDRVVGEVAVRSGVSAGDEVGFAVHHRNDGEHDVQALRALGTLRDAQRDAGRPDLPLGSDDPLRDRRFRRQRGARDLGRGETADRTERQRELRGGRKGRVAASEEERKTLVGVTGTVFRRNGLGLAEQGELLAVPLLAANPVERVVAGGLREPSARVGRYTARAPLPHRFLDRLGDRFLGQIEAAQPPGERRDDARRLLAKHTGEEAVGCHGPVIMRIRHRGILPVHCSMWL